MAAKKQTYEQAMKRLEEIVSRIDSNELDIDSLSCLLYTSLLLLDKMTMHLRHDDFHGTRYLYNIAPMPFFVHYID